VKRYFETLQWYMAVLMRSGGDKYGLFYRE